MTIIDYPTFEDKKEQDDKKDEKEDKKDKEDEDNKMITEEEMQALIRKKEFETYEDY